MVPHASAQSCAVGAPSHRCAEQHDLGRRRRGRSPPRSTTNWSMQTRPRIGRRLPPTATSRGVARVRAGRRRRTRPAPGRRVVGVLGDPGVAVGDRVAGVELASPCASRVRTVIAGTRPRSGVLPGRRVEAVDRDAAADRVEAGARPQQRGRGVGEVPDLGLQAGVPRPAPSASRNAASWRSLAGWSGSSLHAKCDQTPVTCQLPVALAGPGPGEQRRPSRRAARRRGRARCRP